MGRTKSNFSFSGSKSNDLNVRLARNAFMRDPDNMPKFVAEGEKYLKNSIDKMVKKEQKKIKSYKRLGKIGSALNPFYPGKPNIHKSLK